MPHKIIIAVCATLSIVLMHANLRLQGIAMPLYDPTPVKKTLTMLLEDQKTVVFGAPVLTPISFWYELALFSKKLLGEAIKAEDIVGIENDEGMEKFLPYYTDTTRVAFMRLSLETNKNQWCAIQRIPRKGGTYAIFRPVPPCALNGTNVTEIRISFLRATSLFEKWIFIRTDIERLYGILRRFALLDIIP